MRHINVYTIARTHKLELWHENCKKPWMIFYDRWATVKVTTLVLKVVIYHWILHPERNTVDQPPPAPTPSFLSGCAHFGKHFVLTWGFRSFFRQKSKVPWTCVLVIGPAMISALNFPHDPKRVRQSPKQEDEMACECDWDGYTPVDLS